MKNIVMAVLALTLVLAFAAMPVVAAHAQSCVGDTHGAFANVYGSYGWLGPAGGTPGYHGAVGQQPDATGYNNSTAGATCLGN